VAGLLPGGAAAPAAAGEGVIATVGAIKQKGAASRPPPCISG